MFEENARRAAVLPCKAALVGEPAAAQTRAIWATSGRSPIGTLGEDESIRSVGLPPVGKEVRMAPMRVGLAGIPKRQLSALVAIGVHWM
jgi:hypothetical protein